MIRTHTLVLLISGIGVAVLFGAWATPYAVHNSLQFTGTVTQQTVLDPKTVPTPLSLYLQQGATYYIYTVKQTQAGGTFLVLYTANNLPVGSRVFVNSTIREWFIDPTTEPLTIDPPQHYDRIILAASIKEVTPPLSTDEAYLTQTSQGALLLGLSNAALIAPAFFVVLVWFITKKLALWSIVIAVWFYVWLFFAIDVLGAPYGHGPSATLEGALAVLPIAAFVTSKLEANVRARLSQAAGRGPAE